jgi:S-DNA-T family DNA segregation ATPase FtsK/SpoIIIE
MKNTFLPPPDERIRRPLAVQMRHRLLEGLFLAAFALALFLVISLLTYHTSDPSWSNTGESTSVVNWGGRVGAWLADVAFMLCGVVSYLFPFLMVLISWLAVERREAYPSSSREWVFKTIGWVLILVSSCVLMHFYFPQRAHLASGPGGVVGYLVGSGVSHYLNKVGGSLLFITILLSGITLVSGLSWLGLIDMLGEYLYRFCKYCQALIWGHHNEAELPPFAEFAPFEPEPDTMRHDSSIVDRTAAPPPIVMTKHVIVPKIESLREKRIIDIDPSIQLAPGTLPSVTLLNPPAVAAETSFSSVSFADLSQLVEQRLADFGVSVRVVAVHPGPVITRFELDLAPGIKVSKITGLVKDIARSLSTVSVRIVEVIPGKSVIGLEIPNENRDLVTLREILESQRYAQSRSPVSLVLGKDIAGNPVVVDLTKMPHLLVAGTTGSGKSVSLNAMLLSMLFKSTPEQLRLILIDPKMLELSIYDGIPHLLTPVITDMKDAANALRWCVAEMDKRYRLMASLGVRNLASYNQKVTDAIKAGEPLRMPGTLVVDEASAREYLTPLPLIVVIADELADMMMVVGKKVEDLIARIAQKARASGIHLIIATQRPSVDVITGLIKANIPTRIAFQVSSRIDSRTILDQQGAEQLLGHGDMLYLPPGAGVPIRVHGAYVADEEVHRVVAAWRSAGQPEYLYEVTDEASEAASSDDGATGEQDALYDEAVRIVTQTRRASISLVQRRLRIGYNRAARMMEVMESAGVVSSTDHSGAREVLAAGPPTD